jgi:hypothetical protein
MSSVTLEIHVFIRVQESGSLKYLQYSYAALMLASRLGDNHIIHRESAMELREYRIWTDSSNAYQHVTGEGFDGDEQLNGIEALRAILIHALHSGYREVLVNGRKLDVLVEGWAERQRSPPELFETAFHVPSGHPGTMKRRVGWAKRSAAHRNFSKQQLFMSLLDTLKP